VKGVRRQEERDRIQSMFRAVELDITVKIAVFAVYSKQEIDSADGAGV
jgi:hypothetical protein